MKRLITKAQFITLQQKLIILQRAKGTPYEQAARYDVNRYCKILLHRHRVKPANEYRINPQDGSIEKRQPIQEPVKA